MSIMSMKNVNPAMSIIKYEWSQQPNAKAEAVRLDQKQKNKNKI